MLSEEEKQPLLVVHLIIVGFHHKKGHQIEYSYPLLNETIDDQYSNLLSSALPDGAHHREKDLIYFHVPSFENGKETLFAVASYRQIDANTVVSREADVTRNSIQKSVCLLLRRPLYGGVAEELQLLTETYFEGKDFQRTEIFEAFVDRLNAHPPRFQLEHYSIRALLNRYHRRTLILFKLLLLQRKVLFMFTPIEALVKTVLSLVSLVPGLMENGLNECTLVEEQSDVEREIRMNQSEDVVFDRQDNASIDFGRVKLKTLKSDDEDGDEDEEERRSIDDQPTDLFKRATSITSKLSETFTRLTQSATATSTGPTRRESLDDFPPVDDLHVSLELFHKNHVLHPYVSIHCLDLMRDVRVRSYVIGASNGLFRHQTQLDVIVNDHDEELLIQSAELRQELQLTTADLRFAQLFEEGQTDVLGEGEIRRLFTIYLLSLLAVANNPNEEAMNDFNPSFVKSFQLTDAFRLWQSKGPYPQLNRILSRHPQAGQLNVADVKLRVAHVLDDSEAGRKLKGAIQDTSQFMGDKSRAATQVLGQAKNSLFTSLLGGFNQSKQWLAKSPSLPAARPPPSSDD